MIEVQQHPDRLHAYKFEAPDNIPKNITLFEKLPKQQLVD